SVAQSSATRDNGLVPSRVPERTPPLFARRLAALAIALAATGCGRAPVAAPIQAAQPVAAATKSLHAFTSDAAGFDTHSFWYDTGREVIVFDAQFTPALAQQLIAGIRAATRSPITTLVITHPNPDKFNGATAFQAIGAQVVASRATAAAMPGVHAYKKAYFVDVAKLFTAATYPALPKVDRTFESTCELAGGAVRLSVLRHAGVASTQTVAAIPAARALVVGDLVHHQAHAWLEGGIVAGKPRLDVDAWLAALDELKAFPGTTAYGGRGEAAPVARAVADEQAYLRRVREIARAYAQALPAGELAGRHAAAHQAEVAKRIAAAFPSYTLPYLTGYSVYGLLAAI
ncbi:MAG: putative cyclase, partial [Cyanobacteria bacterium RYN_339]|nr:putative cyclase [Cyanobacteria bacterium RYN_339]